MSSVAAELAESRKETKYTSLTACQPPAYFRHMVLSTPALAGLSFPVWATDIGHNCEMYLRNRLTEAMKLRVKPKSVCVF